MPRTFGSSVLRARRKEPRKPIKKRKSKSKSRRFSGDNATRAEKIKAARAIEMKYIRPRAFGGRSGGGRYASSAPPNPNVIPLKAPDEYKPEKPKTPEELQAERYINLQKVLQAQVGVAQLENNLADIGADIKPVEGFGQGVANRSQARARDLEARQAKTRRANVSATAAGERAARQQVNDAARRLFDNMTRRSVSEAGIQTAEDDTTPPLPTQEEEAKATAAAYAADTQAANAERLNIEARRALEEVRNPPARVEVMTDAFSTAPAAALEEAARTPLPPSQLDEMDISVQDQAVATPLPPVQLDEMWPATAPVARDTRPSDTPFVGQSQKRLRLAVPPAETAVMFDAVMPQAPPIVSSSAVVPFVGQRTKPAAASQQADGINKMKRDRFLGRKTDRLFSDVDDPVAMNRNQPKLRKVDFETAPYDAAKDETLMEYYDVE